MNPSQVTKGNKNYFILYIDVDGVRKTKYSQAKEKFCKLFYYDPIDNQPHEVKTEGWIDAYKKIHSIAPYQEGVGYLQARNIFEANAKIQTFIKSKNEKEKAKAADPQLP